MVVVGLDTEELQAQRMAERLGLESRLLELMDETRVGWFSETLLNLFNSRLVLQDSFVSMISRAMALAALEGPVEEVVGEEIDAFMDAEDSRD